MARPIEFNRQLVIETSLLVFREKGYNGTSMRDLEAATGLNPGSFYAAFGNKHDFFIETMRYFYQQVLQTLSESLATEQNPIVGLRQFFDIVVDGAKNNEKTQRCCFLVKSALELALVDEEVSQLVNAHFLTVEEKISEALILAQEKGALPQQTEVPVISKLLINTLYGVNVDSLLDSDKTKLEQMVELLFTSLFAQNTSVAKAM